MLVKSLFVFLLIVLPFGEFGRFSFQNGFAILVNDVVVGIVFLVWLIKNRLNRAVFQDTITKPIGFFILACLLSLLVNLHNLSLQESAVSFSYLLRWVAYAGLYFVVKDFAPEFKKKIMLLLMLAGGVFLLGGYLQLFLYPNLRNLYYAGWDEHIYRIFSSFLDPNFAGIFYVLVLILFVWRLLHFIKVQNNHLIALFSLLVFFNLFVVFLTYSRSALLSLCVVSVYFFVSARKGMYGFAALLIFLTIIFMLPKSFETEGTNLLRITSSLSRVESSQKALFIFSRNPIFGAGFNAYRYAQYRYGLITQKEVAESHSASGTDNSFLFVLATTGITGFLSFMYLLYSLFRFSHSRVFAISLLAVLVNALFINSLFFPFVMEWLWILFGLREKT